MMTAKSSKAKLTKMLNAKHLEAGAPGATKDFANRFSGMVFKDIRVQKAYVKGRKREYIELLGAHRTGLKGPALRRHGYGPHVRILGVVVFDMPRNLAAGLIVASIRDAYVQFKLMLYGTRMILSG